MLASYKNCSSIYKTVMEHSIEAIYIFRIDGTVIYQNHQARKEFQADKEKLYNNALNIKQIFPETFTINEKKICMVSTKFLNKDEEYTYYETVAYRNNETSYPVKLKVQMTEENQEAVGICYSLSIMEGKKQILDKYSKEEYKKAINVKNDFLSNITHELRTPINGIRGLASNLLETGLDTRQIEIVKIIINSCDNMSTIVNDILDFGKISAGKLLLEKREFDLKDIIKTSISYHAAKINDKGLTFILNIGENIPITIIGDEIRLGQILNNFLSNAVKFTMVGQIFLGIENSYQSSHEIVLRFMIKDTGIGISKEEQEKLFISFSQVDCSITRRFGGTGLGLAISKRLIQQMDGMVDVESQKGNGSTFTFTVKLAIPESSKESSKLETGQYTIDSKGVFIPFSNNGIAGNQTCTEDDIFLWNEKKSIELAKENLLKIKELVEQGCWERAEACSLLIKNQFPDSKDERRKSAFRLELAIRKEDSDITNLRIIELQNLL